MKCQSLFSFQNKKNTISLSSAKSAQRVVKVKSSYEFHLNRLKERLTTYQGL